MGGPVIGSRLPTLMDCLNLKTLKSVRKTISKLILKERSSDKKIRIDINHGSYLLGEFVLGGLFSNFMIHVGSYLERMDHSGANEMQCIRAL